MDFLFSVGKNSREIIANNLWFAIPYTIISFLVMYYLGYFDVSNLFQNLSSFDWFMTLYTFFIIFVGWFYPIDRECWKMIILYTLFPLSIFYWYDIFNRSMYL